MRATIRRTNLDVLHGDVDAAMPQVEIEDHAPYYVLRVVQVPDKPETINEDILSGYQVREAIRTELLLGMDEIEQNNPAEIAIRWCHYCQRHGYATQSCTYSKVC